MDILITWALYAAAIAIAAYVIPGFDIKGGLKGTLLVALLFGLLNWALAGVLKVALGLVTLGLAWLFSAVTHAVVTAIVLKLTDALSDRLKIKSFWTALLAGAVVAFTVFGIRYLLKL